MQALGSKPTLPLTQDGHHLYLLSPQKGDTTAGGLDQRLAITEQCPMDQRHWLCAPFSGCQHHPPNTHSFLSQVRPGAKKAPRMRPESSRNFNLLLQQLTLNSALLLLT